MISLCIAADTQDDKKTPGTVRKRVRGQAKPSVLGTESRTFRWLWWTCDQS